MMEFILWVVLFVGTGASQQAALFPSLQACETAKVQLLTTLKREMHGPNKIIAECLPR